MGAVGKSVGQFMGFGDQNGKDAGNAVMGSPAYQQLQAGTEATGNPWLSQAIANYATNPNQSSDSVIQGISNKAGDFDRPGQLAAALQKFAVDPLSGSKFATEQVQNNPILGQLFGKEGTFGKTVSEEQDLAKRGYSLKPEDYEAYGQASGQIARNFGGAENQLAQALSDRGLSNSGVANQQFMSSQGNKLEQLGQLQTQIAQNRMQMNMDRLGQTRNFLSQLGQQGANDINQQYGRQLAGAQFNQSALEAPINAANMAQNQSNKTFEQQRATTPVNIGDALASGVYKGISDSGPMAANAMMGKPPTPPTK